MNWYLSHYLRYPRSQILSVNYIKQLIYCL